MTNPILLESAGGFLASCAALWLLTIKKFPKFGVASIFANLQPVLKSYLLKQNYIASAGLLLLRIAVGVMMIHHGQEKLADPQQFADTYVASLHLPFPLFFAYAAGLGALAITGTMAVAAYQHILTGGFNIYVLELVALYLGGSVSLLLTGPGLFSLDAALIRLLPAKAMQSVSDDFDLAEDISKLAYVKVNN
ncbi:MAG: DoxX family protein [Synechococcaceae bacterium WB5_2B_268]|nr:DoxX family protein [Synechococcaceae bacterium WB5_2B_268]